MIGAKVYTRVPLILGDIEFLPPHPLKSFEMDKKIV